MDKKLLFDIPKFTALSKRKLHTRIILWVFFSIMTIEALIVAASYAIFAQPHLSLQMEIIIFLLLGVAISAIVIVVTILIIKWASKQDTASALRRSEKDRHTITELHKAMKNNELEVYYQSQVDLQTGHIIGMETLIRWNHGERGFISPAEFIPLAEEVGLIGAIDAWVLETACTQNKIWYDEGHRLRVAVNLSALVFKNIDTVDMVAKILKKTKLPPAHLELEITETAMIEDLNAAVAIMHQLRALGVMLSMDDFGTGYTSLSNIDRFPIQKLKIDKRFVQSISEYYDEPSIADSIIDLGQKFKLIILAEGIETEYQMNYFKKLKCGEGQGYYFSEPVPANKFLRLVRKE